MEKVIEEFHLNGYCILESFFSIEEYNYNNLLEYSLNNYNEIKEIIQFKKLLFGVGLKEGYDEIVQRQKGRYEITYKMKNIMKEISENNKLINLIKRILGDDIIIANESLIISEPGTEVNHYSLILSCIFIYFI